MLIADDNRDTVLTLMLLLQHEGHEVQGVYNGADALQVIQRESFDAVILDIEMPQMTGYELAAKVRRAFSGRPVPLLIAMSGKWNKASEKILSRAVGFDHHLEKPCDPNVLLRLLQPLALGLPPPR